VTVEGCRSQQGPGSQITFLIRGAAQAKAQVEKEKAAGYHTLKKVGQTRRQSVEGRAERRLGYWRLILKEPCIL
jgi:hypothetical protein